MQQYNAQANTVEATQPISDDAYTLSNVSVKVLMVKLTLTPDIKMYPLI